MNRQAAAQAAMLAAMSKPKQHIDAAASAPSRSGYCDSLGQESLSRVRDRLANTAANSVAPKPITTDDELYLSDVKHFGVEWANVYRAEREAKSRDERIKAEREKVRLAHIAAEQRAQADARQSAIAKAKMQQEQVAIIFGNCERRLINDLLRDEPADICEEVVKRVQESGCNLLCSWESYLQQIHDERRAQ
jgi:regulator of protease activity HflC (stomatin/prohibitin superfamily)